MDVDTRLLRYVAMIADEGSLTRAAARLYVSQPALTKQVHQLESSLGVELFTRSKAGMTPTPAGAALAEHATSVLAAWDHALRATKAAAARSGRVLRVGFVASAANELTPQIVAEFARRRPGWRVELRQSDWSDPTAGLADGDVDIAFLRLPVAARTGWRIETLLTEPRWVALAATHPLSSRSRIDFSDLLDEPFVATPEDSGAWRDYWLATEERHGHPVRIGAVARNPDEWLAAIANNQGISLTPAATARFYQRPDVAYRQVTGISPSSVAIAWIHKPAPPATIALFADICLAIANDAR